MTNFEFGIDPYKGDKLKSLSAKSTRLIWVEKLNNPLGYLFLSLLGVLVGVAVGKAGIVPGFLLMAAPIGILFVYYIMINPELGILSYLTLAYAIMFLLRLGANFPLGTLMDGMLLLFFLSFLMRQKAKPEWHLVQGPISKWVMIWIVYNILEVGNPAAESRLAWVYTVRTISVIALGYFLYLYNIRTKAFMKKIISFWLFFSTFAAWYAFKQEFFGFFPFEEAYLHSSDEIMLLLFIAGHWRKFSIFSDPVTYAYNMVVAGLMCIGLLTAPRSPLKKWILIFIIISVFYNMLFSGTRGAFPLVPAALILYAVLKYSKRILNFVIVAAVFFLVLVFMPTSNQNILRFQSAFRPNDDASYKVRKINQARIKPYVWAHPIGGGLGSTGEWGKKFAPGSYLSSFPPDSGYVRTTVEAGPIGLLIFVLMMFNIMKTGVDNYFKIKDPDLKSICLGSTLVIFAFNIGNFPQEALVQYPSNVYFYLSASFIVVTKRLDDEQNTLLLEKNNV